MTVFYLFLLATAVGTVSTLFWIPEDDLGRGYFQMNALIVLALLGLATTVFVGRSFEPYDEPTAGTACLGLALAAAFGYYGAVWRERWLAARLAAGGILAAGGAALLLTVPGLAPAGTALPHRELLTGVSLLSSAALLGWSLVAMLLGHWYLVAPRLPFRHLTVFCQVLLVAAAARLAVAGVAVAVAAGGTGEIDLLRLLTGFTGQGMFFWFRVLWGLAMPLSLGFLSLRCARQRANQSATGILYVVVVGAFIGEITAYYLVVTTGVPV